MKKHRVPKLLHAVISTYLTQNFPLSTTKVLMTVTEVNLSPDGAIANVLLSFMPMGDAGAASDTQIKAVMQEIELEKPSLKRYLSYHLGKKIRRIPNLVFEKDHSALKASQVAQLLRAWKSVNTS